MPGSLLQQAKSPKASSKQTTPKSVKASPAVPPASARRKSVAFGPVLSPELIDKHSAPNAPVKRGKTPTVDRARLGTPIIKAGGPG